MKVLPVENFNSIYLSSFYPFTGYNPRIWNLSIHHLSVISQLSQHNNSFKGHKAHNQISTLQYTIPVLRVIEHTIKYPHYSTVNIIQYEPQWLHNLSKTLSTYIYIYIYFKHYHSKHGWMRVFMHKIKKIVKLFYISIFKNFISIY